MGVHGWAKIIDVCLEGALACLPTTSASLVCILVELLSGFIHRMG